MEISHPGMKFAELKFLRGLGSFVRDEKFKNLDFNENYFLNKLNFLFSSWDETKLTIIWRKIMFHHGMKVSTRGQLAEMKFHPRMKYSIFYM